MGFKAVWMGLAAAVFLVVLPVIANAGTVELPKTGITRCLDSTGREITCAGTGQDGEIQAGADWPAPRFTSNGDGTISDNLTGLIWAQSANSPAYASCTSGARTWQAALDYVACLNTNAYLGYNDWRLPNINELESLANLGEMNQQTWLLSQGFSGLQNSYWSSTTVPATTTHAYYMDISQYQNGFISYVIKTGSYYAWPVR